MTELLIDERDAHVNDSCFARQKYRGAYSIFLSLILLDLHVCASCVVSSQNSDDSDRVAVHSSEKFYLAVSCLARE